MTNLFIDQAINNISILYKAIKNHTLFKELREEAYQNFILQGLPNRKSEEYRYTSFEQHFAGKYNYNEYINNYRVNVDEIFKCDVPLLDTQLMVSVNGWFYDNKELKELESGVIIGSLNEAYSKYTSIVEEHIRKASLEYKDPLKNINEMMFQDGLFVYIPKGAQIQKPVQLINLVVADKPTQIYPRHLIISESEKNNQILICDHSLNPEAFIMNGVLEIFLEKNAHLSLYRMQNAHNHSVQITNTFVNQQENSNFHSVNITLHGGLVRNNLWVNLKGKNSVANLNGLWLGDKKQHIDYNTFVKHEVPECESNQLFKGILDDEATGIFSGKILVEKGAQKTNAYQSNKNLIINPSAKVRSRPQLEIYADDVKCSHGSATGYLDEDSMFYLRSRGISKREACQLLMFAFASDVTKQIMIDPLRNEVETLVEKRLRGELSRCNRCNISCS